MRQTPTHSFLLRAGGPLQRQTVILRRGGLHTYCTQDKTQPTIPISENRRVSDLSMGKGDAEGEGGSSEHVRTRRDDLACSDESEQMPTNNEQACTVMHARGVS